MCLFCCYDSGCIFQKWEIVRSAFTYSIALRTIVARIDVAYLFFPTLPIKTGICHSDEQRGAEGLSVGSMRKCDAKIPPVACPEPVEGVGMTHFPPKLGEPQ